LITWLLQAAVLEVLHPVLKLVVVVVVQADFCLIVL
jgi:hypothetical protein